MIGAGLMEPLAHTLVGACLSEAGFKRTSPLATSTLLIAANLPDLDGACYAVGTDLAFAHRRGWTHGIGAMLILPGLLAWAIMAFDRHVRRRRHPDAPPADSWAILMASIAGVLSHPFMDWLNNYGVRLLMPFDDRWFYGDALFIADPWLWLLLGAGVVFAWTTSTRGAILTSLLAVVATGILLTTAFVPLGAKITWVLGIAAIVAVRRFVPARHALRVAQAAAVLAAVYIALMIAGSRIAEHRVAELARARHWTVDRIAAMPVPAQPLRRQVIAVAATEYFFVPMNWTQPLAPDTEPARASRGAYTDVVAAALDAPEIQGVRRWLRFPSYQEIARPDGTYLVIVRDARFAIGNRAGFGVVGMIDLDASLKPVAVRYRP
jgi:inner membrane protein